MEKAKTACCGVEVSVLDGEHFCGHCGQVDPKVVADAADFVPLTDERILIEGEVVHSVVKESKFGPSRKCLVLDNRGFKVWGSCVVWVDEGQTQRVRFMARVERSDSDPKFGFFKRPSKVELLEDLSEDLARLDMIETIENVLELK
tara:strand:- start:796 stop:1233 length:438 start_codon:yes stop_codon:yes gene_type:complete